MTYDTILTEIVESIGWLTINRPKQLNALNADVVREIPDGIKELSGHPDVRVIVVTGAGEKAFVAGADIKAMAAMGPPEALAFGNLGHVCMEAFAACPQPVIAMVNGFALGGGMELALACNFIYASDNAKLGLPEVSLGLFPAWGGTQRLQRRIGQARTMELIFSGRRLSANEAFTWGIVNKVVPQAELRTAVEGLAEMIAQNSPTAIRAAKQVIQDGADRPLSDGLAFELAGFPKCFQTEDCKEGLKAFVEKRKPSFVGK